MALSESRSQLRYNIFRGKEMKFQYMRSMATILTSGAEFG